MARELLSKPDGFLTAMINDTEYIIESIKRVATHANLDDRVTNWALSLRDYGQGNIKR